MRDFDCPDGVCTQETKTYELCKKCMSKYRKGTRVTANLNTKIMCEDDYYMTLDEIAEELGVTKIRVRQILESAFWKVLRRGNHLKDHLD